jgi:Flp pilus assembly protein TadD
MARLQRGDATRGLADLEKAVDRGVDSPEARLQLAALLARNRRVAGARRHLEAARRAAPDDPRIDALLRRLPPG